MTCREPETLTQPKVYQTMSDHRPQCTMTSLVTFGWSCPSKALTARDVHDRGRDSGLLGTVCCNFSVIWLGGDVVVTQRLTWRSRDHRTTGPQDHRPQVAGRRMSATSEWAAGLGAVTCFFPTNLSGMSTERQRCLSEVPSERHMPDHASTCFR